MPCLEQQEELQATPIRQNEMNPERCTRSFVSVTQIRRYLGIQPGAGTFLDAAPQPIRRTS